MKTKRTEAIVIGAVGRQEFCLECPVASVEPIHVHGAGLEAVVIVVVRPDDDDIAVDGGAVAEAVFYRGIFRDELGDLR